MSDCGHDHSMDEGIEVRALGFDVEGTVESTGERVPLRIMIEYPVDQGAHALHALAGIYNIVPYLMSDLAAEGDGSAILALAEQQDGAEQ